MLNGKQVARRAYCKAAYTAAAGQTAGNGVVIGKIIQKAIGVSLPPFV
ncbi:hypothetical protein [Pedobacter psychroterrae]|nr:hypothetical protein [Pedobacter psychroterrae]